MGRGLWSLFLSRIGLGRHLGWVMEDSIGDSMGLLYGWYITIIFDSQGVVVPCNMTCNMTARCGHRRTHQSTPVWI